MKSILTTLLLCLTGMVSVAQLGYSVEEIVEKYGNDYEVGYTDDSVFYFIFSQVKLYKNSDKTYPLVTYFTSDKKDGICFLKMVIYPIDEINKRITEYNEKYVKESNLVWIDYENNIKYILRVFREKQTFTISSLFISK